MSAIRLGISAIAALVAVAACSASPRTSGTSAAARVARLAALGVGPASSHAAATFPARAPGPIALASEDGLVSTTVSIRGARDVAAVDVGGVRLFRAARDGADVALVPREDGFEDFVFFDTRQGEDEIVYDIDVTHVAGLRLVDGTLELLDRGGAPRLRMVRPYLFDATGRRVAATTRVDGCAVDTSAALPWDRPVTAPGAPRCVVRVGWDGAVDYPVVVDPQWQATSSMPSPRYDHASAVLPNGRVLVVSGFYEPNGGMGRGADGRAYAYDPATRTWADASAIPNGRQDFAISPLPSGKLLVLGGTGGENPMSRPEIYDPTTGLFARAMDAIPSAPELTLTLLGNGKVLVAGGSDGTPTAGAHLYDAATQTLVDAGPTGTMGAARAGHSATRLASGKVLIAGGDGPGGPLASAEIYDPATNTFAPTAAPMANPRARHAAALLRDGRVALAGGGTQTTEIYDPATNRFSAAGSLSSPRSRLRAAVLESGHVLFAGGEVLGAPVADVDVLAPETGAVAPQPPLVFPRTRFTLERIGPTSVVAIGGKAPTAISVLVPEIWTPLVQGTDCAVGDDCRTGSCQKGFCCATACTGPCKACSATTGACSAITNADDPSTCTGETTCDAVGACKKKNGKACAGPTECASGACVDGFCCERSCGGQCEACDVTGYEGRCLPVAGEPHGARPECLGGEDPKCGGACNGISPSCAFPSAVTTCAASCAGKLAVLGTCDGKGACVVGSPAPCAGNFACSAATACKTTCAADSDCLDGYRCDGGRCSAIAFCDGSLIRKGAETEDCGAYTCEQSGVCRTSCASVAECTAPNVCSAEGACVAPPEPPDEGCTLHPNSTERGSRSVLLIGAAITALAIARRRR